VGETLTIRNFGPIKDMALDLRQVNVLIGDQGTGKSTVAKVLAAIYDMAALFEVTSISTLKRNDELGNSADFKKRLSFYNIDTYLNEETFIEYIGNDFQYQYSSGQTVGFNADALHIMGLHIGATFIPADRIAVNILSNAVLYSLVELKEDLPGYFLKFGRLYSRLKGKREEYDFTETLGVKFKQENEKDFIGLPSGKWVLMEQAASAFQANVPMMLVFKHQVEVAASLVEESMATEPNFFIIEEPELNCFPETQDKIVKCIIADAHDDTNIGEYHKRLLVTTHSPYILTSLNNLMQAYQTGKAAPEKADAIIPKQYWLNPDDVSAYMLLKDGTCKDILNREEYLIEADEIDSVSRKLNREFEDLLTIEYGVKE
jgi:energy-coupling factor transporter ATP-binding protein EcfA2